MNYRKITMDGNFLPAKLSVLLLMNLLVLPISKSPARRISYGLIVLQFNIHEYCMNIRIKISYQFRQFF